MKTRVYIDTSVFSACFDPAWPDRQGQTQAFFERRHDFELGSSEIALAEIERTGDPEKRAQMRELFGQMALIPMPLQVDEVAREYLKAEIFTVSMWDDARHVAAAALSGHAVLVSWNFKHLVNRRRRAKVDEMHVRLGLPKIDIVAPPEI